MRRERKNGIMTQQELGLNLSTRRMPEAAFLDKMNLGGAVDRTAVADCAAGTAVQERTPAV